MKYERDNKKFNPLLSFYFRYGLKDKVRLLGLHKDIPELLSAMDVVTISSSFGEALPMILLEALSVGSCCVATNIGDTTALLNGVGVIVQPNDPTGLYQAWADVINLPMEQKRERAERARNKILDGYSNAAMVKKYKAVYQQTLGK